jgi:tungstate transport system ATP-binding protein
MSAGTAIIEARDLSVAVRGAELVHVQRFSVESGEVHVVIGPNGAGKTTLLRALNGLIPASGELLFEERPVRHGRDRLRLRRHTAAVMQVPYLLDTTVRGNVQSGLKPRGVSGDELHRRVDETLEMLGIARLADRRRRGLSGGEAQRVSIARALATRPAVLFLDEPMASLDPPTRRALQTDLTGILRRLSTAVVWVTHDISEVAAVADRVTFLEGGHLVQEGTVASLREHPASPTVAEYFLHGDVHAPRADGDAAEGDVAESSGAADAGSATAEGDATDASDAADASGAAKERRGDA